LDKRQSKPGYLILADGTVLEGKRFGADLDSVGELVFTTGVEGYVETLTDPSYYGQIVMQTFPLIGNYGMMEEDYEGKCAVKGYVVREYCDTPSNFRTEYDLDTFLKKNNIPGIWGVDTRALTRKIREHGVMNAIICSEIPKDLEAVKNYTIVDAVKSVTCDEAYTVSPEGETKYHVTLLDYGAKRNIIRELNRVGCEVRVVPSTTSAEEVLSGNPDGVMLSNGPGDPEENVGCIAEIQKMLSHVPIFGICLGHQLMALAQGGETYKLKYGHRGGNQPATATAGPDKGRTYITTQNHGYAVRSESLEGVGEISFVNANDQTCEGMNYLDKNAFSVQFHPEAHAGPQDTSFLFERFIGLMEEFKNA
jgi:carbamoyl-phosphate synthase small subunit